MAAVEYTSQTLITVRDGLAIVSTDYFWSKGYATETAKALVEFGFKKLCLHRVFATCDPENTASARVLEKTGMKLEGHIREHKLVKGKWRDSLLYAIINQQ